MSLRDAADTILQSQPKQDGSFDTLATVLRTDGDTVWVHIDGGAPETPCKKTVECRAGESVMVRISGGSAWITGNHTSPSTDDTEAEKAKEEARKAAGTATSFITDSDNGIFVHPKNSTQRGVRVTDVVDIVRDGKTVAEFGESVQIGETGDNKTVAYIENDGLELLHGDTTIAHLGYGLGTAQSGSEDAPYYTLGTRPTYLPPQTYDPTSTYRFLDMCEYNGELYICITDITTPEAWNPNHWRLVIGNYSIAEGCRNEAIGYASHAEGNGTMALGMESHSEGSNSWAIGAASHSEGYATTAEGTYSHAQNEGTTAGYRAQTAIGKYNDNKSDNAFEIGWGTSSTPKNILEVDTDGNLTADGHISAKSETPTISISTSTGVLDSYTIRKFGNIVFLKLTVYNNSSVASSGNIFTGTINTTSLRPVDVATGAGYWSGHAVGILISAAGNITVRNASSSAFTPNSSNKINISITYMVG